MFSVVVADPCRRRACIVLTSAPFANFEQAGEVVAQVVIPEPGWQAGRVVTAAARLALEDPAGAHLDQRTFCALPHLRAGRTDSPLQRLWAELAAVLADKQGLRRPLPRVGREMVLSELAIPDGEALALESLLTREICDQEQARGLTGWTEEIGRTASTGRTAP